MNESSLDDGHPQTTSVRSPVDVDPADGNNQTEMTRCSFQCMDTLAAAVMQSIGLVKRVLE